MVPLLIVAIFTDYTPLCKLSQFSERTLNSDTVAVTILKAEITSADVIDNWVDPGDTITLACGMDVLVKENTFADVDVVWRMSDEFVQVEQSYTDSRYLYVSVFQCAI